QGRLLGRPRVPLLEEPPQGPDLLAASVVEEELRPLAVLPPARQRPALQGPRELCRAKDQARDEPPPRDAAAEDGRRRVAQRSPEDRQGHRAAGRPDLRAARLRGQAASCREPAP